MLRTAPFKAVYSFEKHSTVGAIVSTKRQSYYCPTLNITQFDAMKKCYASQFIIGPTGHVTVHGELVMWPVGPFVISRYVVYFSTETHIAILKI